MAERLAEVLRAARQAAGLTQTDLAARAGLDQTVISNYETGRSDVPASRLHDLAAALGAPLTVGRDGWQLGAAPPAARSYGYAPCGRPILVDDDEGETVDLTDLTDGTWDPRRCYLVRAAGDSMEPMILADDWLIVDRQAPYRIGQVVVAVIDGETTIKLLIGHGQHFGRYLLRAVNPRYGDLVELPEDCDVALQGVVVGQMRFRAL